MIRPLVLTKKLKLAFEVKDINIARCVGNNNNNNNYHCVKDAIQRWNNMSKQELILVSLLE